MTKVAEMGFTTVALNEVKNLAKRILSFQFHINSIDRSSNINLCCSDDRVSLHAIIFIINKCFHAYS
ncbi:MAG: hypothetical protein FWE22_06585 [Firmicutes bacterium]|nr:hypothetical protein [Bacillota bacterium]